jgi:3-phosphoshikimate 1-carboxyvinyltransferase
MKLKIFPITSLQGEIIAPPSKSYSHRAFIAASLAKGVSILKNPLTSGDVGVTIEILKVLGHRISKVSENSYMVKGNFEAIKNVKKVLNCKNSGTSIRIFCALAILIDGGLSFSGKFLKRERPIIPLLKALENLGGVYELSKDKLSVKRKGKKCDKIELSGNISSQFLTALLMTCPLLTCKKTFSLTINITTPIISYPYIKMTLDVLKSFGINIQEFINDKKIGKYIVSCEQNYRAQTYEIPGDFSSASFFIAATVLTQEDSKITISNLNFEKPQGDQKLIEILQKMGAKIEIFKQNNRITVFGNLNKHPLNGISIDIEDTPDLFPILSVVGSFANGKTELYNASSIRGKESDRLSLVAHGLKSMGVKVKEEEDRLTIYHCTQLKGIEIIHEDDHRIAMAFSIAALFANSPSYISNIEVVKDSYPNFIEDLQTLGVKVEKLD